MKGASVDQRKEDRRVRITKQAIRESLIELMAEYPISKISVKMICEAADINRSTFYAHYTDQYDLLRKLQQEVIADIRLYISGKSFTEDSAITVPLLTQVLEYARDNTTLLRVLLDNDRDRAFQNDLMLVAQDQMMEELQSDVVLDPRTAKYLQYFALSGFVSILKTWLDEGTPEPPEHMAEMITKLLFQGMSAFYR